ncbi:hypothetical protein BV20DRAFT_970555 [Pilatotrama ljubarskyi]|nr:hypothetical protein BV20DRAFT_970555 [Pilatotrama ljubarskyi]
MYEPNELSATCLPFPEPGDEDFPQPTLAGLIPLALRCHRLTMINVVVNARAVPEIDPFHHSQTP